MKVVTLGKIVNNGRKCSFSRVILIFIVPILIFVVVYGGIAANHANQGLWGEGGA